MSAVPNRFIYFDYRFRERYPQLQYYWAHGNRKLYVMIDGEYVDYEFKNKFTTDDTYLIDTRTETPYNMVNGLEKLFEYIDRDERITKPAVTLRSKI